jgi:hypothetical protein
MPLVTIADVGLALHVAALVVADLMQINVLAAQSLTPFIGKREKS